MFERPLSHDMPCSSCGHALHHFLPCGDTCDCDPPPTPGIYLDPTPGGLP